MDVRAVEKNIRVAPRKLRLLADMVRGKKVDDAVSMLLLTPTPSARAVAKAIMSAAANAENGFQMSAETLVISRIFIDPGMTMKRYRSAARGRVSPVLKRSSHITVIVTEQESYGTQS